MRSIEVIGIPNTVSDTEKALIRSRLTTLVKNWCDDNSIEKISLTIASRDFGDKSGYANSSSSSDNENTQHEPKDSENKYLSVEPSYSFESLVLPDNTRNEIMTALDIYRSRDKIFTDWGLYAIEPFPKTALNFHGPSGTGKTLAAHAIASFLNKKVLISSYAQIESKYHGEGPKNVEAIFKKAQDDDSVLFIDEADSLLSKRLTNVTQGSEQAINSMRSQILISLSNFKGVVIFATNLVANYDKAFDNRVNSIEFFMPEYSTRTRIWQALLISKLPLAEDISIRKLSEASDNLSGRDIKDAVIYAAINARSFDKEHIDMEDFLKAIQLVRKMRTTSSENLNPTSKSLYRKYKKQNLF